MSYNDESLSECARSPRKVEPGPCEPISAKSNPLAALRSGVVLMSRTTYIVEERAHVSGDEQHIGERVHVGGEDPPPRARGARDSAAVGGERSASRPEAAAAPARELNQGSPGRESGREGERAGGTRRGRFRLTPAPHCSLSCRFLMAAAAASSHIGVMSIVELLYQASWISSSSSSSSCSSCLIGLVAS